MVVGHGDQVGTVHLSHHDTAQPALRQDVDDPLADHGGGHAKQVSGLLVEDVDLARGINAQHPLPDAVQHRLALLHQGDDLCRFESEGHPLDGPGQHEGGRNTQRESRPRVEQDVGHLMAEPDPDLRLQQADRHLADGLTLRVEHRRPSVGRAAEAAVVHPGVHLAVQGHHGLLDALPDLVGVGVGVAHAVPADDDHVRRP